MALNVEIARAFVTLEARTDELRQQLSNFQKDMGKGAGVKVPVNLDTKDIQSQQTGLQHDFLAMGKRLALQFLAGWGAVKIGKEIVSGLTEIDSALAQIGIQTKGSSAAVSDLYSQLKSLSSATGFGLQNVIDSFMLLQRGGNDAQKSMMFLTEAIKLARASGEDLKGVADDFEDVAKAFGVPMQDISQTADLLAGASRSAEGGLGALLGQIKLAAPMASALGVSLRDLSAMITLLGNAGIDGNRAIMGLNNAFLKLEELRAAKATPKELADLFDKLGSSAEQAFAKFKYGLTTLPQMTSELRKMHVGIEDMAKILGVPEKLLAILLKLGPAALSAFGQFREGAIGVTEFLKQMANAGASTQDFGELLGPMAAQLGAVLVPALKGTTSEFDKLVAAQKGFTGEAQRQADLVSGTLSQSFQRMGTSIKNLFLDGISPLLPAFKSLVSGFAELLEALSKGEGAVQIFSNSFRVLGDAISAVLSFLATLLALLRGDWAAALVPLRAWAEASYKVFTDLANLIKPINILVPIIVTGKDVLQGTLSNIAGIAARGYQVSVRFVLSALDTIKNGVAWLNDLANKGFQVALSFIAAGWEAIEQALKTLLNFASKPVSIAISFITAGIDAVSNTFNRVLQFVGSPLEARVVFSQDVPPDFLAFKDKEVNISVNLVEGLTSPALADLENKQLDWTVKISPITAPSLMEVKDKTIDWSVRVQQAFAPAFEDIADKKVAWNVAVAQQLEQGFMDIAPKDVPWNVNLKQSVTQPFIGAEPREVSWLVRVLQQVAPGFLPFTDQVYKWVVSVSQQVDGIIQEFTTRTIPWVIAVSQSLATGFQEYASATYNWLVSVSQTVSQGFIEFADKQIRWTVDLVKGAWEGVEQALERLLDLSHAGVGIVVSISQSVARDFITYTNRTIGWVVEVSQAVIGFFTEYNDATIAWIIAVEQKVLGTITAFSDKVYAWLIDVRQRILGDFLDYADRAIAWVIEVSQRASSGFVEYTNKSLSWVVEVGQRLATGFTSYADQTYRWLVSVAQNRAKDFVEYGERNISWLITVSQAIQSGLLDLKDRAVAWVVSVTQSLASGFMQYSERTISWIINVSQNVVDKFTIYADQVIHWLVEVAQRVVADFKVYVDRSISWVIGVTQSLAFGFVDYLDRAISWVIDVSQKISGQFAAYADRGISWIIDVSQQVASNFVAYSNVIYKWVINVAQERATDFVEYAARQISWVVSVSQSIAAGFADYSQRAIAWVINISQNLAAGFIEYGERTIAWTVTVAQQVAANFVAFSDRSIRWTVDLVKGAWEGVEEALEKLLDLSQSGISIVIGLSQKLSAGFIQIASVGYEWIVTVTQNVASGFVDFSDKAISWIVTVAQQAAAGFVSYADQVYRWLITVTQERAADFVEYGARQISWLVSISQELRAGFIDYSDRTILWLVSVSQSVSAGFIEYSERSIAWVISVSQALASGFIEHSDRAIAWVVTVSQQVAALVDYADRAISWIINVTQQVAGNIVDFATRAINWVISVSQETVGAFVDYAPKAVAWIISVTQQIAAPLTEFADKSISWLISVAQSIAAGFKEYTSASYDWVVNVVQNVSAALIEFSDRSISWVVNVVMGSIADLTAFVDKEITWLLKIVPQIVTDLSQYVDRAINWLVNITASVPASLSQYSDRTISWAIAVVQNTIGQITNYVDQVIHWVIEASQVVSAGFVEYAEKTVAWVVNVSQSLSSGFLEYADRIIAWVVRVEQVVAAGLIDYVERVINWTVTVSQQVLAGFVSYADRTVSWLVTVSQQVGNLVDYIDRTISWLIQVSQQGAGSIIDFAARSIDWVIRVSQETAAGFVDYTSKAVEWVVHVAQALSADFVDYASRAIDWVVSVTQQLASSFTDYQDKSISWLIDVAQSVSAGFREYASASYEWLINVTQNLGSSFIDFGDRTINWAINLVRGAWDEVEQAIERLLDLAQAGIFIIVNLSQKLSEGFVQISSVGYEWIVTVTQNIAAGFIDYSDKVISWTVNLVRGSFELAEQFTDRVVTWIVNIAQGAVADLSGFIDKQITWALEILPHIAGDLSQYVDRTISWLVNITTSAPQDIGQYTDRAIAWSVAVTQSITEPFQHFADETYTWTINAVKGLIDDFSLFIDRVVTWTVKVAGEGWEQLNVLSSELENTVSLLSQRWSGAWAEAAKVYSEFIAFLKSNPITAVINEITKTLPVSLPKIFLVVLANTRSLIGQFKLDVENVMTAMLVSLQSMIPQGWNLAWSTVQNSFSAFLTWLQENGISKVITTDLSSLANNASSLFTTIASNLHGLWEGLVQYVTANPLGETILKGISGVSKAVEDSLKGAIGKVRDFFGTVDTAVKPIIKTISDFMSQLASLFGGAKSTIQAEAEVTANIKTTANVILKTDQAQIKISSASMAVGIIDNLNVMALGLMKLLGLTTIAADKNLNISTPGRGVPGEGAKGPEKLEPGVPLPEEEIVDVTKSLKVLNDALGFVAETSVRLFQKDLGPIADLISGNFAAALAGILQKSDRYRAITEKLTRILEKLANALSFLLAPFEALVDVIMKILQIPQEETKASAPAAGFRKGGFTGAGAAIEPAGIVHKGEYVVPASVLQDNPGLLKALELLRAGNKGIGNVEPRDSRLGGFTLPLLPIKNAATGLQPGQQIEQQQPAFSLGGFLSGIASGIFSAFSPQPARPSKDDVAGGPQLLAPAGPVAAQPQPGFEFPEEIIQKEGFWPQLKSLAGGIAKAIAASVSVVGRGSGSYVGSHQGAPLFLTASHVAGNFLRNVEMPGISGTSFSANAVKTFGDTALLKTYAAFTQDENIDRAAMVINNAFRSIEPLGPASQLRKGDWVAAASGLFSEADILQSVKGLISEPYLTRQYGYDPSRDNFFLSAGSATKARGGFSGAPIVNARGDLVSILLGKVYDYTASPIPYGPGELIEKFIYGPSLRVLRQLFSLVTHQAPDIMPLLRGPIPEEAQSLAVPAMAVGGEIQQSGLAFVHAGESVLPAARATPLPVPLLDPEPLKKTNTILEDGFKQVGTGVGKLVGIAGDTVHAINEASQPGRSLERLRLASVVPGQPLARATKAAAGVTASNQWNKVYEDIKNFFEKLFEPLAFVVGKVAGVFWELYKVLDALHSLPVIGWFMDLGSWIGRLIIGIGIADFILRHIPIISDLYKWLLGDVVKGLWEWLVKTFLAPLWAWFVTSVLQPLWTAFLTNILAPAWQAFFANILSPMWQVFLNSVLAPLWQQVLSPLGKMVFDALSQVNWGNLAISAGVVYLTGQLQQAIEKSGLPPEVKGIAKAAVGVGGGALAGMQAGATIGSIVPGVGTAIGGLVGGIIGGLVGLAASLQEGGVLTKPGLAMLHANETVLPLAKAKPLGTDILSDLRERIFEAGEQISDALQLSAGTLAGGIGKFIEPMMPAYQGAALAPALAAMGGTVSSVAPTLAQPNFLDLLSMPAVSQPQIPEQLAAPQMMAGGLGTGMQNVVVVQGNLVIDDPDITRRIQEYVRRKSLAKTGISTSHTLLN